MYKNPIIVAIVGWVLFPSMYLTVGLLARTGLSVPTAFIVAAPLGVIGFLCWVFAFGLSGWSLIRKRQIAKSIFAILICLPALLFLALGFWASLNGA